jgi:predicted component of type VI protein secretion system
MVFQDATKNSYVGYGKIFPFRLIFKLKKTHFKKTIELYYISVLSCCGTIESRVLHKHQQQSRLKLTLAAETFVNGNVWQRPEQIYIKKKKAYM